MSTFFYLPDADTPTFWETLVEGHDKYGAVAPLTATRPGTIASPEPVHTMDCKDPYGPAAWCDCNHLTWEDAACDGCDDPACRWNQF